MTCHNDVDGEVSTVVWTGICSVASVEDSSVHCPLENQEHQIADDRDSRVLPQKGSTVFDQQVSLMKRLRVEFVWSTVTFIR